MFPAVRLWVGLIVAVVVVLPGEKKPLGSRSPFLAVGVGAASLGADTLACKLDFVTSGSFPARARQFRHNGEQQAIRLEESSRTSHRIVNRILKILLQEVAGYKQVSVHHCPLYDQQNVSDVFDRVSGRMTSKHCQPPVWNTDDVPETNVYLEALVPPGFNKRPWLEWRAGSNAHYLVDAGPLGYRGRKGWYLSTAFVSSQWLDKKAIVDHWRSLQLPRVNRELSWWGRKELTTFKPDYEKEALKNHRCQDGMKGRRRSCSTLFAGFKDVDYGILKGQIEQLELKVDIVWMGDALDDFVSSLMNSGKPVLFFKWQPSALLATGNFTRMKFPESSIPWQNGPQASDFPVNQLTKVTWAALKTGAPEAFHIISNLSFTEQEYDNILVQASNADSLERVACDWLQANEAKWLGWLPKSVKVKAKIYLGGLFPLSGQSVAQPGLVEGAKLALDLVNQDSSVLPNHRLELLVRDTQCHYDLATSHFISLVRDTEHTLAGILGPGCSDPAERIASLSKNFHLMMVSYGAEAEALSNRQKYPYFFRTVPPVQRYSQVYPDLFRELGWGLVAALAEDGQKLPDYHLTLQDELQHHGISLIVKRKYLNNSSVTNNIAQILQELKSQNVRVIIADVFSHAAREIMCEAYKQGMTAYQGYVWFLPAWYPENWWDADYYNGRPRHLEGNSATESVPCTSSQLSEAIQGHFILSKAFTGPPDSHVAGGITVQEYKETYAMRCGMANVEESNFASFVYDAVWVFAKGLHTLLEENQVSLKTLHTNKTAFAFRKAISELKFTGVSGNIWFDQSDRSAELIMLQFFSNGTKVIGHYIPSGPDASGAKQDKLKLNLSAIRWLSAYGPMSPQKEEKSDCALESVRTAFNVSCVAAYLIIILIPVLVTICILVLVICKVKRGVKEQEYQVTHDRMKELGLLKEEDKFILLMDDWEVPLKDIVLNRELGEGAFGTVMGGEMHKEHEGWVSVAVKTLKSDFRVEEKLEFLSEVDTMKKLSHANIVQLLGVCTREVIYAIMEFMLHGNLKTFLLSRRHLVGQGVKEAEDTMPERLTQMAVDVARGLDYLHNNKFVHRDLACRNCLVHANKTVKIGDFGMTRHVSDSDIYVFARKGMLPVRWTAPESLKDGIYTAKSDIWSFGVLVFEIVTFGSFPYQGMANKEVLDYVGRGLPLPLPDKCPRDLQTFIKWCMSPNPDFRPDLTAILTELQLNNTYLTPCLDAPAFSVEHDNTGSLEIPVMTSAQSSSNLGTSVLPFTSFISSRGRSLSFHDKPNILSPSSSSSSPKKKNFTVSGFTPFVKMGRASTSSKKSPTSSRSSSHCSGVVMSNSMCGIQNCGIGTGWRSRPSSGVLESHCDNAQRNASTPTDNTWHGISFLPAREDVRSVEFSEDLTPEEEESGMVSLLGLKESQVAPKGRGSCSDVLEHLASSSSTHPLRQGSQRSLSSLRSNRQSPRLTSDRGVTGSSGYLSQNSRAEARHICQTVTSL